MTLACHQQYTFSFEIKCSSPIIMTNSASSWESHQCILQVTATFAICAVNPHFSGCAKTIDGGSVLGIFFVSVACSLRFFLIFVSAFVNLSLGMWHASLSYFLSTVLPSGAPSVLLYWVSKHFYRGISQFSFVLIFIITLFYDLGRFRTSSGVAGCAATFEVNDDLSGGSSKSQKVHSCYWKLLPS